MVERNSNNLRVLFSRLLTQNTAVNGYSSVTYFCMSHKARVLSMRMFRAGWGVTASFVI